MTTQTKYPLAVDGERLERIEHLLRLYPDIDDVERDEVLGFLKSAPILDSGLLTGIAGMQPQLERFRSDHRHRLGLGVKDYAVLALIVVAVIVATLLLWDAGTSG